MLIKRLFLFILVVFYKQVSGYLRVCYYTNWSQYRPGAAKFTPDSVDPSLCSHIIFAFAKLEGNQLAPFERNDETSVGTIGMYERINSMKMQHPHLKTLLAVGGWNAGSLPFSDLVATKANRQAFINSTVVYLRQRNFNGLDIDWEYPAKRGGRPADKQNLVAFLSELRRAFEQESYHTGKERLLLTCAVPAGKVNIDTGYDVPNVARNLDFINIMTYDMHGSWETVTGHNSPLYGRARESPESSLLNMDWAAKYWLRQGAPKHKLVMGFGLYGRSFKLKSPVNHGMGAPITDAGRPGNYTKEAGFMAYYEVCEELKAGATRVWDPEHKVPYLYKGNLWVGYDDEQSIREKMKWLKTGGYGGVMVWSLALDDFSGSFCSKGRYPLLNVINDELKNTRKTISISGVKPGPGAVLPAMPPVVVSDRILNSGLSVDQGRITGINIQQSSPLLAAIASAASDGIQTFQPKSLPPSAAVPAKLSNSDAGVKTHNIPVMLNVPPSVAQVVSHNIDPSVANIAQSPPILADVIGQQATVQAIPNAAVNEVVQLNNLPVDVAQVQPLSQPSSNRADASVILPGVLDVIQGGHVMDPSNIGLSDALPSNTVSDLVSLILPEQGSATANNIAAIPDNVNVMLPLGAATGAVAAPNGVVASSSAAASNAVSSKPNLNFSFSSSSSSSSNSSSSSSNSSSSSKVNLSPRPGLSIAAAIQQALSGSPSDAVIIDLPHTPPGPAVIPVATSSPGGNIVSVVEPSQNVQPAIQLRTGSGGTVIPVTSVTSLEELLSTLNTNLPTANAVLLPEPNTDLTPALAMRELTVGNVLQAAGLGGGSATLQGAPAVPTLRLSGASPAARSRARPLSTPTISRIPSTRGTGIRRDIGNTQRSRALAAAIRRNPALRARVRAALQRRQRGMSSTGRLRPGTHMSSARFPIQRIQRSRTGLSTSRPRTSRMLSLADIQRLRRRSSRTPQRSPDSTWASRRRVTLTPSQFRALQERLRRRASLRTRRTQPQILSSRTSGPRTLFSRPRTIRPSGRTTLSRDVLSRLRGLTL